MQDSFSHIVRLDELVRRHEVHVTCFKKDCSCAFISHSSSGQKWRYVYLVQIFQKENAILTHFERPLKWQIILTKNPLNNWLSVFSLEASYHHLLCQKFTSNCCLLHQDPAYISQLRQLFQNLWNPWTLNEKEIFINKLTWDDFPRYGHISKISLDDFASSVINFLLIW